MNPVADFMGNELKNIFYSSLADCTFISEPGGGRGRVGEDRRGRVAARMKDIESDHNIYYGQADRSRSDSVLKKLQGDGVDAHSQAVDPMFVDPENGDFRLKPNLPALKLGIEPLDVSKMGRRDMGTHVSAQEETGPENNAGFVKPNGSPSVPKDLTIKESSFCKSLKAGKAAEVTVPKEIVS